MHFFEMHPRWNHEAYRARVSDEASRSHLDAELIFNWKITQYFTWRYIAMTTLPMWAWSWKKTRTAVTSRLSAQWHLLNLTSMIRRVRLVIFALTMCANVRSPLRKAIDAYRNSLSLFPLDSETQPRKYAKCHVALALTPNSRSPIFFPSGAN